LAIRPFVAACQSKVFVRLSESASDFQRQTSRSETLQQALHDMICTRSQRKDPVSLLRIFIKIFYRAALDGLFLYVRFTGPDSKRALVRMDDREPRQPARAHTQRRINYFWRRGHSWLRCAQFIWDRCLPGGRKSGRNSRRFHTPDQAGTDKA